MKSMICRKVHGIKSIIKWFKYLKIAGKVTTIIIKILNIGVVFYGIYDKLPKNKEMSQS